MDRLHSLGFAVLGLKWDSVRLESLKADLKEARAMLRSFEASQQGRP